MEWETRKAPLWETCFHFIIPAANASLPPFLFQWHSNGDKFFCCSMLPPNLSDPDPVFNLKFKLPPRDAVTSSQEWLFHFSLRWSCLDWVVLQVNANLFRVYSENPKWRNLDTARGSGQELVRLAWGPKFQYRAHKSLPSYGPLNLLIDVNSFDLVHSGPSH
jgi:hypothetical protein